MYILDFAASLVAAVSGVLLALLLFVLRANKESVPKPYLRVKRCLALGMLCNAIYHSSVITEGLLTSRPFFVDLYFSPFLFYVQLYLFYNSLCALLHLKGSTDQSRTIYALPMALLFVLLAGFCVFSPDALRSVVSFNNKDFNFWTVSIVLISHLLYFFSSLRCMVVLFNGFFRNREHLDNYYADGASFNEHRLVLVTRILGIIIFTAVLYSLFSLASVLSFILQPPHRDILNTPQIHTATTALAIVLSTTLVLVVLSMQKIYYNIHLSYTALPVDEGDANNEADDSASADEAAADICPISEVVEKWEQSEEKPYLSEGLTLAIVADELGTTTRILSAYIHKFRHVNFNTWINQMRVTEIKRLLLSDPTLTMLDIAVKTGFNDAAAMCNVFKRFAEITPTQYRKLYANDEP